MGPEGTQEGDEEHIPGTGLQLSGEANWLEMLHLPLHSVSSL